VSSVDASIDELLKRRAEQLARNVQGDETGDELEVLICRLGQERYAVETRTLRSVQWASGIAPVPSTPPWVVGIVSVRGEIVTLFDLSTMIGLSARPRCEEPCAVLLLGLPGLRCGLVVDEVLGVERLRLSTLQPSLSGREFARGLAPGPTVLLDVEQLMASGRFIVDEDNG
jgi:purine-binding chemotaxis protein CheW